MPLKGTLSAQKALQRYETETSELLEVVEEISVLGCEGSLIEPVENVNTVNIGFCDYG